MPVSWWRLPLSLCWALATLSPLKARAQLPTRVDRPLSLRLAPAPVLPTDLLGRPILAVDVVTEGGRWQTHEALPEGLLGQAFSAEQARRITQALLDTGRYARASVAAAPAPGGVRLVASVLPRKLVAQVRVTGNALEATATMQAAGVDIGEEMTVRSLREIDRRVTELYRQRGFPQVAVSTQALDTDAPMEVVLFVRIHAGPPALVHSRSMSVEPPAPAELRHVLEGYSVEEGDRADREALASADIELQARLHGRGYPGAKVSHSLGESPRGPVLEVSVELGARHSVRFEGNVRFDDDELGKHLRRQKEQDSSLGDDEARSALLDFYSKRGFLDATVSSERRTSRDGSEVAAVMRIREGRQVRVRERRFPCLTGRRDESDVRDEIDSFLTEALPGTGLFGPVDSNELDLRLGSGSTHGFRAVPLDLEPYQTYDASTYERALEHLTALYRSEGYLSAQVGPVRVVRSTCSRHSPAGRCIVEHPVDPPPVDCSDPAAGVEVNPGSGSWQCVPDAARGRRCDDQIALQIPIRLGPRAALWDIGFSGNKQLVEAELFQAAGLALGKPVSQLAVEEARQRVIERYAEDGYAFAGVEADIELSADGTRAKASFRISERQPVRVRDIVVKGARFTEEPLIRARIALERGELYRRSLARQTEDQLGSLGTFTSVTVDLEDPEVPAQEKVVLVEVQERLPQYLDVRPGFSTGQGLRVSFEYGHRNLASRAIRLALRMHLGYLPPELILDDDARSTFQRLLARNSLKFLLGRRLSATVELPEIGLGPTFRLNLEGLNVRDIFRPFAREKSALITTLGYRPSRRINASVGASLEFNEVEFYANILEGQAVAEAIADLGDEAADNQALLRLLNVPEGLTVAVAERIGVTWDRRDNPVAATRGTLASLAIEHVDAYPIEDTREPSSGGETQRIKSHFLRYSARLAGYLRLNRAGLSLATSLRVGINQQLVPGSQTYPDRYFFMGGVDSFRGATVWSVLPEDAAQDVIDREREPTNAGGDEAQQSVASLAGDLVPGGNLLINPRAELRIPLTGVWQTAVFLDTGNLWVDPNAAFDEFRFRYAAGTGLRATTPVGPLAVDVGFNLSPRKDPVEEERYAFHFSIGLF